jgi:hypothetical protein
MNFGVGHEVTLREGRWGKIEAASGDREILNI